MKGEYKLRVFISYSGKGRDIWEPLVQLLKDLYQCRIIWGQEEVTKHQDPEAMMEAMVRNSDVAIFLLTNDSDGVFRELKLWHRYNSFRFANALLLKDHSVSSDILKSKAGFDPPYITFSANDPWADIQFIFPAINKLLKNGFLSANIPSWQRSYNKIIHKYNWKTATDNVPLNRIIDLFNRLSNNPEYVDPEAWSFRINWHVGSPEVDSYSDKMNCLRLLDALLQTTATRHEYEFVFGALDRLVKNNKEPPRKLSGNIIFSGCSISTIKGAQKFLGNHPYEKSTLSLGKRAQYAEQVPDQPESLLLPKNVLTRGDNYEKFINSQKLILSAVSKVCKYVLCSTMEITASHSFVLSGKGDPGPLAMSCTATRTNKETLSAISEVPVILEDGKKTVWFGQPYKKPTSEYRPHWIYHSRSAPGRVRKNLLIHFHPIELVDIYRKVQERDEIYVEEEEFIDDICCFFRGRDIDFHVFKDYAECSARDPQFGTFMRHTVEDDARDYSVIWKPNHGIWVFTDEANCSDAELVKTLLTLDNISQKAALSFRPRNRHDH